MSVYRWKGYNNLHRNDSAVAKTTGPENCWFVRTFMSVEAQSVLTASDENLLRDGLADDPDEPVPIIRVVNTTTSWMPRPC